MSWLMSWKFSDIFNNGGETVELPAARDVLPLCSTFSQRSICPCGPKTFIFLSSSSSSWPTIRSVCFSFSFGLRGALQILKITPESMLENTTLNPTSLITRTKSPSFTFCFDHPLWKWDQDFSEWLAAQCWWQIRHIFPNIPPFSNYGCHCFSANNIPK